MHECVNCTVATEGVLMKKQGSSEHMTVSRRDFMKISIGAITLLPTVSSALLLPNQQALAAEQPAGAKLVTGPEIYVVSSKELALTVADVSLPAHSPNLIPGARVRIISRYNGMVLEGTTDEHGGVYFDISNLAEGDGKAKKPAVYAFNATIEVEAEGYRTFKTGLYRVTGGVAMSVPTQPREKDMPYPLSVSFDEWDILYTVDDGAEFVCCTGNDITHTLVLELDNCDRNASVRAGLYANGIEFAGASGRSDGAGRAHLEFKSFFLLAGSNTALPTGGDHPFTMRYTMAGTTYELPITLQVDDAPPEGQTQQVKSDLALTPFGDDGMFLGITVPKGFPIMGGQKLKLWQPEWPVNLAFDPFGFIRIKVSTPDWGYVRDNGKPDPNGWKFHPRKTAKAQYDEAIKLAGDAIADSFGAFANGDGAVRQIGFTQSITFSVAFELIAAGIWSFDDKDSRGRATLQLRAGANYSLTETFWLGPFPVAIRFGIGVCTKFAGEAGFISPSVWSFSKYRWDYGSTGLDLQISVPITLAIGVGVPGIASAMVQGFFSLTFFLHEGPLPKGFEKLPKCHLRLAGVCVITVDLEMLFFTQSISVWNSDWPDWYNNWKDGDLKPGNFSAMPDLGSSLKTTFDNAKIISSQSFAQVAEYITDGISGMQAQEEKLTLYTLSMQGDDGKVMTQQLYLTQDKARSLSRLLAPGEAQPATSADALSDAADSPQAFSLTETNGSTISRWTAELPEAVPTGLCEYVEVPLGEKALVASLGREAGIVPETDICIASNILSASRSKVYSIDGSDWVFRLGVVMVAGEFRTRVIAEEIGTSERRVIDFEALDAHFNPHDFLLDYDFDLCSYYVDGRLNVSMVVVSGLREKGDATSFSVAAATTTFSYVCCTDWRGKGGFTGTSVSEEQVDACGLGMMGEDPYKYYHLFSCPQIVHIEDETNPGGGGKCVVTYLERASETQEGLLSDVLGQVYVGVGVIFFDDNDHTPFITDMVRVIGTLNSLYDVPLGSITEASITQRINGWHLLSLTTRSQTYVLFMQTLARERSMPDGSAVPRIKNLMLAHIPGDSPIDRLVHVPGQDYFLTCSNGKLKKLSLQVSDDSPALVMEDFGGEELNIGDFGVLSTGDVLYWPAFREGGHTYQFSGNDEAALDDDDDLNLIMGARIRSGKMCKPFVIGEVRHAIHRLRSLSDRGDRLSFISSTTLVSADGKGEQWYTAIPWVRCANLLGASPRSYQLAPGDQLPFMVMIRNDGNCYLSGVTLDVREAGKDSIGTINLVFSKDTLLESEWNPRTESGELANVEDDYALAPGMTSLYYAEHVLIPETWEGSKELEISVIGVRAVNSNGLLAQPEDSSIEYLPDQAAQASLSITSSEFTLGASDSYQQADVKVLGSKSQGDDKNNGSDRKSASDSKNASGPNGSGRPGGTLPKMGDDALGSLAGMLALGGASLVAYGSRKAQAERERDE